MVVWFCRMSKSWRVGGWCTLHLLIGLIGYCHATYDAGLIKCSDSLDSLNLPSEIKEFMVECPNSCMSEYHTTIGSGPYQSQSNICVASIHNGTLGRSETGKVLVMSSYKTYPYLFGTTRNGVKSKTWLYSVDHSFITTKIEPEIVPVEESTTTLAPTTTSTQTGDLELKVHTDNEMVLPRKEEKAETPEKKTTDTTHMSTDKPPKPTTKFPYQELKRAQETTTLDSHEKIQITSTHASILVKNFLGLSSASEHVLLLLGVFLAGVLLATCGFLAKKKLKKQRRKIERKQCCGGNVNKGSREPYGEGEICVCYQNLNSSKQGLLYDPETCDRPCPIRQSHHDNAAISDAFLASSVKLSYDPSSLKHEIKKSSNKVKCDIRYEDDCANGCSGVCNPQDFEF